MGNAVPIHSEVSTFPNDLGVEVEWRIDDFLSFSEVDGIIHVSHHFSLGGHSWYLDISPNGAAHNKSSGHIDLGLTRCSSGPPAKQALSIALKTRNGQKYCERHGTKVFEEHNCYLAFHRFLSRSELTRRSSELLPYGALTVVCTMMRSTFAEYAKEKKKKESTVERIKSDKTEVAGSDETKVSGSGKIEATETKKSEEKKKKESTAERNKSEKIKVPGSDKTKISDSGKIGTTEIKKSGDVVTVECSYCKKNVVKENISTHVKKCLDRPIKCPECSGVVPLQNWHDHECKTKRTEGVEKKVTHRKENKDGQSEVYVSDKYESSSSNQTCDTEIKESVSSINLLEKRDLVTDISDFLKDRRGIDVTFELETQSGRTKFFAHRLILSVMSPYFADEFYGKGRNEGHQVIRLKGINLKAFEQMIRHCYGLKPCLKTTEDVCSLFKVASDFKVISLLNLCRSFLRQTEIEPGNVFNILEVLERMEDKSLTDRCYKILQEKTRDVIASYEMCVVTPAMVNTILGLPKLSLNSEHELIKWIFDWAEVKSGDKGSSCRNVREYLKEFLKAMNFIALTVEEFAMLCRNNPNCFSSDEMASIYQNIACPGTREMPKWYENDSNCRVYTGLNK